MSAEMSSREPTAGRTSSPVMIAMSSIARTLAGSAMATMRVAVVGEGDGHRVVALGGGRVDQVGGRPCPP